MGGVDGHNASFHRLMKQANGSDDPALRPQVVTLLGRLAAEYWSTDAPGHVAVWAAERWAPSGYQGMAECVPAAYRRHRTRSPQDWPQAAPRRPHLPYRA